MAFFSDLISMTTSMLADWPLGTFVALLLIVVVLILLGLVFWGLFIAVDSWFLPKDRAVGHITEKSFTPGHYDSMVQYNVDTKMTEVHQTYIPDDWSVTVDVNGDTDDVSVTEEFYRSVSKNDPVLADYVLGRISGALYIKDLQHA